MRAGCRATNNRFNNGFVDFPLELRGVGVGGSGSGRSVPTGVPGVRFGSGSVCLSLYDICRAIRRHTVVYKVIYVEQAELLSPGVHANRKYMKDKYVFLCFVQFVG